MTAALLALLIAGGASVWIFTKLQNHTGYGNSKNAAVGAGVVFVIGFLVVFTIAHSFLK
ncbi:MAG: hypothetical protein WDN27_01620 [Candidatus Saccharibacteria bacterium]